jgi:hypothetical protein
MLIESVQDKFYVYPAWKNNCTMGQNPNFVANYKIRFSSRLPDFLIGDTVVFNNFASKLKILIQFLET